MPLSSAQSLFSAFTYDKSGNPVGLVSYVTINTIYKASINPADYLMIKRVINDLRRKINNPDINILGWHQLNKQMYQEIMTDNVGGLLMLLILFVIIGIGVFGTVLMMTLERKKEFGILLAIGMSRAKLINMLLWEMLLITLLSIFLAIITSLPIVIYGHSHPIFLGAKYAKAFAMFNLQPIMPLASPGLYMIVQPLIIFLIIMLTVIYPVLFLSKLKVTKALHD
jgi:ABC-type antimicrobial peptide transport system permease subunit